MNDIFTHPFSRYASIIDDWPAFSECLKQPLPRSVWLNPLKNIPHSLKKELTANWQPTAHWPEAYLTAQADLGTHWAYHAGLYHLQEVVSMLPVVLLNPQPSERILDLCAAPGSKTVQMALAMQNQGTLVANDKNYTRSKALRYHLERLGIINVTTTTWDAATYPTAAGLFDKILVDVPCSGEGTSRKNAKEWKNIPNMHNVNRLQQRIVKRAIALCKPGGYILYSTCTYAPEENEYIINAILQDHPELTLVPITLPSLRTTPGLTSWQNQSFRQELALSLRIWPHHNNTGGFYLALLQKNVHPHGSNESCIPIDNAIMEELQTYLAPFALLPGSLENYQCFKVPKHGIYLVNKNHLHLPSPQPEATGMFVLKTHMQHPKLTTAGARLVGHLAQEQIIDLDLSQLQSYLRREELVPHPNQLATCKNTGYVIVRHQGLGIGVGLLLNSHGSGNWRLQSLYPKQG